MSAADVRTDDDAVTDPISLTYGPSDATWYHDNAIASAYNNTLSCVDALALALTSSFSNHPNATYSFSFSSGATSMAIWVGKKADRGSFTVYQDGVEIGTGDAYDASAIDGTAPQQVFTVSGLDTAPRVFRVMNSMHDDRIGAAPCVA